MVTHTSLYIGVCVCTYIYKRSAVRRRRGDGAAQKVYRGTPRDPVVVDSEKSFAVIFVYK